MAFEKSARDLKARHRHPEGSVTARREVLSKRFLHFCFLKVQTFFEKCLANEQMFMGFFSSGGGAKVAWKRNERPRQSS
jgi:hypothetical protein